MPGGVAPVQDSHHQQRCAGDDGLTASLVIICIVASSAGLIFGYDIGITGGVTTMEPFLKKFFPSVLAKMMAAKQNQYCIFDSQVLMAFTSSLYIAGLVSSLIAGRVTTAAGRKGALIIGGVVFLIGTALNAFAEHVAMLILGRLLLGFGIGFTNQAAPIYLAEMSPPKWRGTLTSLFQFFLSAGSLLACFINYMVFPMGENAWRYALAFAAVPATLMTFGAVLIPDTPSSLIQRGKVQEARLALSKVRPAKSDTESEINDLIKSHDERPKMRKSEAYGMLFQRKFRPHLVLVAAIPSFQQLTGISLVAFYAPVLFKSIGQGTSNALLGAVILGAANCAGSLVSAYAVDKYGRRFLFLEGSIQIFLSLVAMAIIFAVELGTAGIEPFSQTSAIVILVLMASISISFGWSWGPLTWIVPSEILPTELRAAGLGVCIASNFIVTFIISQTFMAILCKMKFGAFLFFAAWVLIMTLFVGFFVPETKRLRLDNVGDIWQSHWFWRRYVEQAPR
uniref:Major facilitator superfamily (MFS) profile domain-containing protein n=1 Tax=Kalanchoe fedtschenkoi TaxID=63787 RepID=A0A7N0R8U9_KALFE